MGVYNWSPHFVFKFRELLLNLYLIFEPNLIKLLLSEFITKAYEYHFFPPHFSSVSMMLWILFGCYLFIFEQRLMFLCFLFMNRMLSRDGSSQHIFIMRGNNFSDGNVENGAGLDFLCVGDKMRHEYIFLRFGNY